MPESMKKLKVALTNFSLETYFKSNSHFNFLYNEQRFIKITCEKWSAALSISVFARATSSFRPVTTNTGSSPRTGVFIYVFVFALKALILQPKS